MIKEKSDCFFKVSKGLIIDNSYDLYTLNSLIKYYKEKQIEYLYSQDNDLSYLNNFKDVKFLSIPQEATNFDALNSLKELKGLSVWSNTLSKIQLSVLENVEYLEIIFDQVKKVDFSMFKSLKCLRIIDLPFEEISITDNLEQLEFNYCKKISNLDFLKNAKKLNNLKLSYLSKLENIDVLKTLYEGIEKLNILDCGKITNLENVLGELKNLTELKIATTTNNTKLYFKSLSFLEKLSRLRVFATNYKIIDGNLNNLLNLEEANITAFYKNYNLTDKDLPHIDVIINDNGDFKKVKLSSLELGKEDLRIVWLK